MLAVLAGALDFRPWAQLAVDLLELSINRMLGIQFG